MGYAKISPIRRPPDLRAVGSMSRRPRLSLATRPLPSSGFRFPKSGMRTPEFRRIGNSRCEALRAGGGQAPGILHHITIRGIERRRIFRDSKDQDDLLARLEDLIPGTNMCPIMPGRCCLIMPTFYSEREILHWQLSCGGC